MGANVSWITAKLRRTKTSKLTAFLQIISYRRRFMEFWWVSYFGVHCTPSSLQSIKLKSKLIGGTQIIVYRGVFRRDFFCSSSLASSLLARGRVSNSKEFSWRQTYPPTLARWPDAKPAHKFALKSKIRSFIHQHMSRKPQTDAEIHATSLMFSVTYIGGWPTCLP